MSTSLDNLIDTVKKELFKLDSVREDKQHLQVRFKALHTDDITFVTFGFKLGGIADELKGMIKTALNLFENSDKKIPPKKSRIFLIEPQFKIETTLKFRRKRKFEIEDE